VLRACRRSILTDNPRLPQLSLIAVRRRELTGKTGSASIQRMSSCCGWPLRALLFSLAALPSVLAACNVRPPDGIFACQESRNCPLSMGCYGGVCRAAAPPAAAGAQSVAGVSGGSDPGQSRGLPPVGGATPGSGGNPAQTGGIGNPAQTGGIGNPAQTGGMGSPVAGSMQNVVGGSGTGGGNTAGTGNAGHTAGSAGNAGASAGGGSAIVCKCATHDACCDGCLPQNEAGSCTTDSTDCTNDVCRAGTCAHERKANACLIAGICYADAQDNPSAKCQYCDSAARPAAWSFKKLGAACDDGQFCDGVDSCDGSGSCASHSGDPCSGTDPCKLCDEPTQRCSYSTNMTFYDSASGLLWEVTPSNGSSDWAPAIDKCAALTLCGHDDWRLPTISELRTLVRGCASTQTGGSCSISDACLTRSCDVNCETCDGIQGPSDGNFWPPELMGNSGYAWSSSTVSDDTKSAWIAYFLFGWIGDHPKLSTGPADAASGRCARTGR
jgi:hypothetical protein